MEEQEIKYPYFVSFNSEASALERVAAINDILTPEWRGTGTDNYDNPREDVNGSWWVIVQPETEHLFSIEELSTQSYYEQLSFQNENTQNP